MTSALHVYPSSFSHESRILKETKSLADSGLFERIYIGAIWADGLAQHEELDKRREVWRVRLRTLQFPGKLGKVLRLIEWYLRLLVRFRSEGLTFVNCHSLSTLPLGVLFRIFCACRIIYDTHELETETQGSRGIRRRLAKFVERVLIGQTEAVIVVSESIGAWYRAAYGLSEVHVVRNIPNARHSPIGGTKHLREGCGLGSSELLFVYQGVIGNGRGIQILLEAFAQLPIDRHIVFLGDGPLVDDVRRRALRHRNIHHLPAVPPHELLGYTAEADVGLVLVENVCLSYYYSLPNKLFEYIMCGVPAIVSDFPEMARLVDETGCGWKSPVETRQLAELVGSLVRNDIQERAWAARQASKSLSWQTEAATLVRMYQGLVGSRD